MDEVRRSRIAGGLRSPTPARFVFFQIHAVLNDAVPVSLLHGIVIHVVSLKILIMDLKGNGERVSSRLLRYRVLKNAIMLHGVSRNVVILCGAFKNVQISE